MRICVDFDGTIARDLTPLPGAIETLLAWQRAGHELMVWTARPADQWGAVYAFLRGYGIGLAQVRAKPGFDLFIDDRSLNPRAGWDSIASYVEEKEKYIKT